jgi:HPr kinase/phosphorylase
VTYAILVHATAIAIEGSAKLLRGPLGAGKSDLAPRLIYGGARLVADDRPNCGVQESGSWHTRPPRLRGL